MRRPKFSQCKKLLFVYFFAFLLFAVIADFYLREFELFLHAFRS